MRLPELHVGDTWTWVSQDAYPAKVTYQVTGQDEVEGHPCYVIQISMIPSPPGMVGKQTMFLSQGNLEIMRVQSRWELDDGSIGEETSTFSYSTTQPRYPLYVGKTWEVTKIEEDVASWRGGPLTFETSSRYEVERREGITVAAGSFRCFKVVRYDHGSDRPSAIAWLAPQTKCFPVRWEDRDEAGNVVELASYTLPGD